VATSAGAQIVNPAVVQFQPSPDHNLALASGQPALTRYDLEVYLAGASAPFQVTNMGKPAPQADGLVYFDYAGQIASWPPPGGIYESRVAAVGPAGTSRSAPSNTFTIAARTPVCVFTVTPTSFSVGVGGGTAELSVTTDGTCAWTVANLPTWITASPTSGTGNGSIWVSVAANASSGRTATFAAAGQAVTVNQAGGGTCTYAVSPTALSVGVEAAAATVNVTAPPGCGWTASSASSWALVSPASSSGSGSVSVAINYNPAGARSTALLVAGQRIDVSQAGGGVCTFSVSPSALSIATGGSTSAVTVNAPAGCAWTAASNAGWATVSPASGTGSATVSVVVGANASASARSASLEVAGQAVPITQAGMTCTFAVSPTTFSFGPDGATGTVSVSAPAGCAWTVSSGASWASASPTAGSGNGSVTLSVAANTAGTPRAAGLVVAGQSVSVQQAAVACSYSVPATTLAMAPEGGTATLPVTAQAACAWTAGSNAAWLTASPTAGSGSGSLSVKAAANSSANPRSGLVTVGDKSVTVTQPGVGCSYTLSPTNVSVPTAGGSATVGVTSPTGCSWTASSGAWWLTISPASSSVAGPVTITAVANSASTPRDTTVMIAGQAVTVTQPGVSCRYGVSPTSVSIVGGGGNASVAVTAPAGCAWSTSTTASWISASPSSGSGDASVTLTAAANSASTSRSDVVTIGGQSITVKQAAAPACAATLSPKSATFPRAGGGGDFALTVATRGDPASVGSSTCSWTTASDAPWITVTTRGGTGDAIIKFTVAANPDKRGRRGAITVAGQSFDVRQAGHTPGAPNNVQVSTTR
jgi:hypothetical protein